MGEKKDKKNMAAYKQMMKSRKMNAAKAKLQKDVAKMMQHFKKLSKGKSKAHQTALRRRFSRKFKALKAASPYYRGAQKLRDQSAWFHQYKHKVGSYVRGCAHRVKADVA